MINVVYKKGQLTTHMRYHPKVFSQVTKYMLKHILSNLREYLRMVSHMRGKLTLFVYNIDHSRLLSISHITRFKLQSQVKN